LSYASPQESRHYEDSNLLASIICKKKAPRGAILTKTPQQPIHQLKVHYFRT